MTSNSLILEYIQAEIISIVDSLVLYTFSSQIFLSDIYDDISRVIHYIEIAFNDELINASDYEYYNTYFSFIKYAIRFIECRKVRAPSGVLTLEKNKLEESQIFQ